MVIVECAGTLSLTKLRKRSTISLPLSPFLSLLYIYIYITFMDQICDGSRRRMASTASLFAGKRRGARDVKKKVGKRLFVMSMKGKSGQGRKEKWVVL